MSVYSFGKNKAGQLGVSIAPGIPFGIDSLSPVLVEGLKDVDIVKVACGDEFSLALTNRGDVWAWGRNREGCCGQGDRAPVHETPQIISSLQHENIVDIAAGSQHAVAVSSAGRAYIWGRLYRKATGDRARVFGAYGIGVKMPGMKARSLLEASAKEYLKGDTDYEEDAAQNVPFTERAPVPLTSLISGGQLPNNRVRAVACGHSFTLLTTESGALYSMGVNDSGQLGLGHRYSKHVPERVDIADNFASSVAAGRHHSVCVTSDGRVITWGLGIFGALGHGELRNLLRPKMIETLKDVLTARCGAHFTVTTTKSGKFYIFGHAEYGQHAGVRDDIDWEAGEAEDAMTQGAAAAANIASSIFYDDQSDAVPDTVHQVSATIAADVLSDVVNAGTASEIDPEQLSNDDELEEVDWGMEDYNWVRRKKQAHAHSTPRCPPGLRAKNITAAACGALHSLVLTSAGDVLSWGWGAAGQLGQGDRRFQLIPKVIPLLRGEKIVNLGCGEQHSLVVMGSDNNSSFALNFKPKLDSELWSDITHGKTMRSIKAHRAIVYARCPKLYSLQLLQERFCAKTVNGDIGLSYFALRALLHFIYTDQLRCPDLELQSLIRFSKKVHLVRLTRLAQRALIASQADQFGGLLNLKSQSLELPPSMFSEDMKRLRRIDEHGLSDLHIVTAERVFDVHRIVLASRSSYFAQLLGGHFSDSALPSLDLSQTVSAATFELVLRHLYESESCLTPETCVELLAASDMFLLSKLKQDCERYIVDIGLEEDDDLIDLLAISDLHQAPKLKQAVLDRLFVRFREHGISLFINVWASLDGELKKQLVPLLREWGGAEEELVTLLS